MAEHAVERRFVTEMRANAEKIDESNSGRVTAIVFANWAGLLPLPYIQFWEAENIRRLDSSRRGGRRRDISCLVDASDLGAVNALKSPPGVAHECRCDVTTPYPKFWHTAQNASGVT